MKGNKMSNLVVMPDGNAISHAVIKSVQLINGKGVLCKDAQQRVAAWVPISDDTKGKRVRDIMIRIVEEGQRSIQPDWSFLESEVKE
jgi:hypothetical protein